MGRPIYEEPGEGWRRRSLERCEQIQKALDDYRARESEKNSKEEEMQQESHIERALRIRWNLDAGKEKHLRSRPNDAYVSQGKYGLDVTLGWHPLEGKHIGRLSGIPGDETVRDHYGYPVGKVKDLGSQKIFTPAWWAP